MSDISSEEAEVAKRFAEEELLARSEAEEAKTWKQEVELSAARFRAQKVLESARKQAAIGAAADKQREQEQEAAKQCVEAAAASHRQAEEAASSAQKAAVEAAASAKDLAEKAAEAHRLAVEAAAVAAVARKSAQEEEETAQRQAWEAAEAKKKAEEEEAKAAAQQQAAQEAARKQAEEESARCNELKGFCKKFSLEVPEDRLSAMDALEEYLAAPEEDLHLYVKNCCLHVYSRDDIERRSAGRRSQSWSPGKKEDLESFEVPLELPCTIQRRPTCENSGLKAWVTRGEASVSTQSGQDDCAQTWSTPQKEDAEGTEEETASRQSRRLAAQGVCVAPPLPPGQVDRGVHNDHVRALHKDHVGALLPVTHEDQWLIQDFGEDPVTKSSKNGKGKTRSRPCKAQRRLFKEKADVILNSSMSDAMKKCELADLARKSRYAERLVRGWLDDGPLAA